ncbi:phage portal protein [Peribacillus simplex]|uniref:Phage portal protein n=2 Tax=Peribacillus TaxID=2675229 RepID=A0AA90P2N4_9BACI|nr:MULTISPECIES: phage portal protein [Peribacillus]MDP1419240.1 phage portal protein [Peribacillus simplex]MDP1452122.1 phage portal protein [Peribacillus frigoritolerans]
MEINKELLDNCVKAFREQQLAYTKYQNYYDGKHDILNNYQFSENRSNMKIVVNFFKKFLTDELAYSLNNPVNYIDKLGNTEYIDRIDTDFSTWEKVHDQKLVLNTNIFGHSFELRYFKDNEFKATVLTPLNCFVLEGQDADKTVELAMNFFKKNRFSEKEMCDLYLPNKQVIHYEMDGDDLKEIGRSEHAFMNVPVTVSEANLYRRSMLDDIKELIDAYNCTISNMCNELSDFRMAILKVIGTKFNNEDDVAAMSKKGVIQLQTGSDIDYLIKNLPDAFANSSLREIKENIYKLASHIDTNEKMTSNTSSSALRGRLITLENKCSTIHTMLEQVIKSRLKEYFTILKATDSIDYNYRLIKLKFTMNIPQDLLALADIASKFKDVMSLETIYGLLPFVENPQMEYEKFIKQQENMMGFEPDLDAISDDTASDEVPLEEADTIE